MNELAELPETVTVTIALHRRPDGGLRVGSPTLPGLALSGLDQDAVLQDIGPAIRGLLEHAGSWPEVSGRGRN